jgi:hypothetical protein
MEEKSSCLFPCSRTFVQLKIKSGWVSARNDPRSGCLLVGKGCGMVAAETKSSPYDGAPAERARNCTGTGCATSSWTATSGFGSVHGGLEEEDAVVSRPQPRIPAPVSPRKPSTTVRRPPPPLFSTTVPGSL